MKKVLLSLSILLLTVTFSVDLLAKSETVSQAEKLYSEGQYKEAADLLAPLVTSGDSSIDSKTLILYGNALDNMTEAINTEAEMQCYRRAGAPRTPACMTNFAEKMNAKYGAGAFKYFHEIITIKYTGAPLEKISGKDKDALAEADYIKLTKNLIGHPSVVLPRIRAFLEKYPSGEWNKKGKFLYARVNEDVWWIHRNWAWLLYNWNISDDELIVRAEPYRQEAIKIFKEISGGKEGKEAKKELNLLLQYKSDGKIYGIINESDIKGVNVKATKSVEGN